MIQAWPKLTETFLKHIGIALFVLFGPNLTVAPPPLSSPDCSGIADVRALEHLQEGLIRALRSLITRRRPDDASLFPKLLLRLPDLRTLNCQHSDKLLAFRIDP